MTYFAYKNKTMLTIQAIVVEKISSTCNISGKNIGFHVNVSSSKQKQITGTVL